MKTHGGRLDAVHNYIQFCDLLLMVQVVHTSFASQQCTGVRFDSLLSGRFTTMAVINAPERKMAKRTPVHCKF